MGSALRKGSINYRVLQIDTSLAQQQAQILPPGQGYDSISVISIPGGLDAALMFGSSRDPWPVLGVGQEWKFRTNDDCPLGVDDGLYMRNNAVAGFLVLGVSFGATEK